MSIRLLGIAILSSTLLLQGCLATVAVGTVTFATSTLIDPRGIGTQLSDTALEAKAVKAISNDESLRTEARIVVTVFDGKVLLTGQSPNQEMIDRAKGLVKAIDGAKALYNEVRLGEPVSVGRITADGIITSRIRTNILTGRGMHNSHLKVTTENNEVFLMGITTRDEADSVANMISKMRGVNHVTLAITTLQ